MSLRVSKSKIIIIILSSLSAWNCYTSLDLSTYKSSKTIPTEKYSVSIVSKELLGIKKIPYLGVTVEQFTMYKYRADYIIGIKVQQNKDFEFPDSSITLECFTPSDSLISFNIDPNTVNWTFDDSFNFSFPLEVAQHGWIYCHIAGAGDSVYSSQEELYHHLSSTAAKETIYLNSP